MAEQTIQMYALLVFAFMSWLIFVLTMCKFYKFITEFELFRARVEAEQNSMICHLRKAEDTRQHLFSELKRTNKLLNDIYRDKNSQGDADVEFVDEGIQRLEKKTGPLPTVEADDNATAELAPGYHAGTIKECFNL